MQGDRAAAHGAVEAAASGGGLTGSALNVIQDLSGQAMYNARQQVYRGVTQANADIYQSSVAKDQGIDSLIGGTIGAGSSLVGGWAQSAANSQYMKMLGTLRGLGGTPAPDYGWGGG